jgi:methylated-DNA-[protein]-cysteine S-methyltransferase
MKTVYYTLVETPCGCLVVAGDGNAISRISFAAGDSVPVDWKRSDRALARARRQLAEYFAGKRRRFDLKLATGGTDFQRRVWREVGRVPYGATITYRQLATRIGQPQAVRAVGAANGQNPIPIVIGCHRIVGSDGTLRGYGGGLDVKRFLLELEKTGRAAARS